MLKKWFSQKGRLVLTGVGLLALCAACTPRPSDRYLFTRGAELKPGEARGLALHVDLGRQKLAEDLAQAFQVCLVGRNTFFSGMVVEGPKVEGTGQWQISLRDTQNQEGRGRDVLVTIGGPPAREGILKALPKEISLGKAMVTVKRVGAVNRTDSVLGIVADYIAGLSPCDGVAGTGVALVPQRRIRPSPTAASMPVSYHPSPALYPQFYR